MNVLALLITEVIFLSKFIDILSYTTSMHACDSVSQSGTSVMSTPQIWIGIYTIL